MVLTAPCAFVLQVMQWGLSASLCNHPFCVSFLLSHDLKKKKSHLSMTSVLVIGNRKPLPKECKSFGEPGVFTERGALQVSATAQERPASPVGGASHSSSFFFF